MIQNNHGISSRLGKLEQQTLHRKYHSLTTNLSVQKKNTHFHQGVKPKTEGQKFFDCLSIKLLYVKFFLFVHNWRVYTR